MQNSGDNLPVGIAVLDESFVLRRQNRRYSEYMGLYSPFGSHNVIGQVYFNYMPGSALTLESWFREVKDCGRSDTVYDYELPLKYETGFFTTYWDGNVSAIYDSNHNTKGILIFCIDITQQHHRKERLRKQKKNLR